MKIVAPYRLSISHAARKAVQFPAKHARDRNRPGAKIPQCRTFSRLEHAAPVHPAHRRQCCGRRPAPPHLDRAPCRSRVCGGARQDWLGDAVARRTKAAEACGILDGVAAIGSSPRVATHRARTPTLDNGASHAPIAATRIGGRSRPSCAVDHRGARGEKPWSKACAQPSRLDAPCALADVPRAIWRVPCRGRHCPVPCCAQARGCVRLSFECR
jgi:hypothetical protein